MTAILTKYYGATDRRGSRIKANAGGKSFGPGKARTASVPYPHQFSGEEAHFEAVKALCSKFNWHGWMIAGGTEDGYAFVFVPQGTDGAMEV